MRQLTMLHDAPQAHLFADYLHALDIEARIDAAGEGWVVWIFDEDHLPRAREELQAFLANPREERFLKAARRLPRAVPEPEAVVPVEPVAEEEVAPPRGLFFGRRLTTLLILFSGLIYVFCSDFNPDAPAIRNAMLIATPDGEFLREGLPEVRQGQVWRLVTPAFLHFGPLHLLLNVLWLFYLGRQIEARSGPLALGGLVLVLAVLSNLGQYYFPELRIENGLPQTSPSHMFGGLSGVVFGLFGYVWMRSYFQSDSGLYIAPNAVILMLGWFVLCTTGLVANIANTAHGVGLLAGMVLGYAGAWWNGWGPEEVEEEADDGDELT